MQQLLGRVLAFQSPHSCFHLFSILSLSLSLYHFSLSICLFISHPSLSLYLSPTPTSFSSKPENWVPKCTSTLEAFITPPRTWNHSVYTVPVPMLHIKYQVLTYPSLCYFSSKHSWLFLWRLLPLSLWILPLLTPFEICNLSPFSFPLGVETQESL